MTRAAGSAVLLGPGKACLKKLPVDPPELNPARKPKYGDGLRVMVKCMRSHGFGAHVDGDVWGLASGDEMSDGTLTAT